MNILLLYINLLRSVNACRTGLNCVINVFSAPLPAVYSDWSVLSKLFLGFVHLSDKVDEALSGFWHALFRPVVELELADCSGLAILKRNK